MSITLIDLSSIAHPLWHSTPEADANPDALSVAILAKVRSLATGNPHVAICVDSKKSFRRALDPTYKAQRMVENRAVLYHQVDLALERLRGDGFPIWSAEGFEADDVIATACQQALEAGDHPVLIVSADKDLLQLVGANVEQKNPITGNVLDEFGVLAKFGVKPSQMRDRLTIVGDVSDNIKGVEGIGAKGAATLLENFGTLDSVYQQLDDPFIKPGQRKALEAFRPQLDLTRQLITLRTDVEIPFAEVLEPRTAKDAPPMSDDISEAMPSIDALVEGEMQRLAQTPLPASVATMMMPSQSVVSPPAVATAGVVPAPAAQPLTQPVAPPPTALAVQAPPQTPDVLAPAPEEWERQLEPRSFPQAQAVANRIFESKLFGDLNNAQCALVKIMAGREVGLAAMASQRAFHLMDGKAVMAADLIRGLVMRSGKVNYFRCTERTATQATFEAQRDNDPPITLTYTIAEGRIAFPGDDKKFAASGWGKSPADMCVARAGSKLARLIAPDVVFGLYSPEEFDR